MACGEVPPFFPDMVALSSTVSDVDGGKESSQQRKDGPEDGTIS